MTEPVGTGEPGSGQPGWSRGPVSTSAVVTAVILAAAAGWVVTHLDSCKPEELQVAPAQVRRGGTVTLSAGPSTCGDPRDRKRTSYRVTLLEFGHGLRPDPPLAQVDVPVSRTGAFTRTFTVPHSARLGSAYFDVEGSNYGEDCHECPEYTAVITIVS